MLKFEMGADPVSRKGRLAKDAPLVWFAMPANVIDLNW